MLVDRKGRKFLLAVGTAGIIVSLLCTGALFMSHREAASRHQERRAVDGRAGSDTGPAVRRRIWLAEDCLAVPNASRPTSLVVIYSYGDFRAASQVVRSDDAGAKPIEITRDGAVPANKVVAFFSNPFGDLDAARTAPLKIENALITPVPEARNGWMVAITLFVFMASFAIGPGVCVWLALVRTDANADPLEWNEHCAGFESGGFDHHRRDFSTDCWQVWIFDHVLRLRGLHGDLFRHGSLVPAGDEGQDAGRDRSPLRRRESVSAVRPVPVRY